MYLEREALAQLLHGLRTAAAPRSRLAISLSVATSGAELAAGRAAFDGAVRAMGEPARTVLLADDADGPRAAVGPVNLIGFLTRLRAGAIGLEIERGPGLGCGPA